MKKAVLVVGKHHAGKSKTINKYLKPKLRIGPYDHKFSLDGKRGTVLSQSREEAALQKGFAKSQSLEETGSCADVAQVVKKYSHYDLLVMAARPSEEDRSCLDQLTSRLRGAGYRVSILKLLRNPSELYYRRGAAEILSYLVN
jgi:hypothetical protein